MITSGSFDRGSSRLQVWRIAYASAKEVDSHMRLLVQAGAINRGKVVKTLSTFDEVRAMTWRLINRKN